MGKLLMGTAVGAMALAASMGAVQAQTGACLITKTETNPFWVKMREGATAKAKELGIKLYTYAGKFDGDNQGQVAAIETCMAAGVKGILIAASAPKAIVATVKKAEAKGILVIALDTPMDPITAADATFATDNFRAGKLIGEWAKATLGAKAKTAKIAMLDLAVSQPTVGVLRDQGFLSGFGIDIKNPNKWGDETDKRIVGHAVTGGAEQGGLKAMEDLLVKDPTLNVVYTINEPSEAGAYQALKAVGRQHDVLTVSVDGGCPGVRNIKAGLLGATSQQYPLLMATKGIEAIKAWVDTGAKPKPTPGKKFFDTGVQLVTDHPIPGIPSISSKKGLALCWG